MARQFQRSLFIFRRDLRLEDNIGLQFALEKSDQVIVCFIFTPEQIKQNPYRSDHCLQFMIESLVELEEALDKKGGRLFLFFDKMEKVVTECIRELKIDAVVVNQDYTPYSLARDAKIESICKKGGASFHSFEDALLHPIEETRKSDGKPYTIFTPYHRNAERLEVALPVGSRRANYYTKAIPFSKGKELYDEILPQRTKQRHGGRKAALAILSKLSRFSHYATVRDFPAEEGTTHLSAHLKFTTCSVREAYYAIQDSLGANSPLLRSLYWRDFFTSIAFHFPHVFSSSFHPKYDKIRWNQDESSFKRWCEGNTGFPIVDAGMREMNETGFMHNRVRMIVASFLVKDLHIDWHWGEKYFAQTLIDYDPAVNNGNWQWVASTGCDAQPYFRVFNPWAQQAKFDPDCAYIKQWVPEIAGLAPDEIHTWHLEQGEGKRLKYPKPMVDHAKEAKIALAAYIKAAK